MFRYKPENGYSATNDPTEFNNPMYGNAANAYEASSKPNKVSVFTPPSDNWGKLKLNINNETPYDDEDSDSERSGTQAVLSFCTSFYVLFLFA